MLETSCCGYSETEHRAAGITNKASVPRGITTISDCNGRIISCFIESKKGKNPGVGEKLHVFYCWHAVTHPTTHPQAGAVRAYCFGLVVKTSVGTFTCTQTDRSCADPTPDITWSSHQGDGEHCIIHVHVTPATGYAIAAMSISLATERKSRQSWQDYCEH